MENQKRHTILKKGIFYSAIFLLTLPMLQQAFNFLSLDPLSGYVEEVEKPKLTTDAWLSGEFQEKQEKYIDENIGFRSLFVRVYNQQQYSLFGEYNVEDVVIGLDNYMYEQNYIDAYYGKDFIGNDSIQMKVDKLVFIDSVLKQKGKELIVLLAPGKGSFYPEFIPFDKRYKKKSITNFQVYRDQLEKTPIRLLNFHDWFDEMKSTSPHPLFPRTGIHWSKYAEILVADSLINTINQFNPNKQLPTLVVENVKVQDEAWDSDDDIEDAINLLFDIQDLEMAYPVFRVEKRTSEEPKVLVVSDSYFWGMYNYSLISNENNEGQFWYYNELSYSKNREPIPTNELNLLQEIEEQDVIMIICTDANLPRFAFGFIDNLAEVFDYK